MEQVLILLNQIINDSSLLQATLSDPRQKNPLHPSKVKVKPIMLRGELQYQFSYTVGPKVLHENLLGTETKQKVAQLLQEGFKQGLLQTQEADYQIRLDKKGKASVLKKSATKTNIELSHNRKKQYLLEEGTPVPFLVELGIMNAQGKVLAARYGKFRQINRFLEMIEDIVPYLNKDRRLQIIDFGCGKSYLTFALYHFLVHSRKLDVNIIGLDLKADVIAHCNTLAQKLDYGQLHFSVGDIAQYEKAEQVDMVVTLHACDTATDAALEKAVRWDADVILSVPCCQHELFRQVSNEALSPMLNHGIIKERFAALATDSVRAHILELLGYRTQILEFIDLEHTPKNLLIRAVKQEQRKAIANRSDKQVAAYLEFKKLLQITPYLETALIDRLEVLYE